MTLVILAILFCLGLLAYRWWREREYFVLRLIRHGESTQNTGEEDPNEVGDHKIRLTPRGWEQALGRGRDIGREQFENAMMIYHSPYRRTRETRRGVLLGAGFTEEEIDGMPYYEDLLLREVEHGYGDVDAQDSKRKIHGYFYYRFEGGESPADCYDRLCIQIDSLWNQFKRKIWTSRNFLFFPRRRIIYVFAHGLTNRLYVMRWLHLTVEQFDTIDNPDNCDVITIAPTKWLTNPQFKCGRWGVEGLRFRKPDDPRFATPAAVAASVDTD